MRGAGVAAAAAKGAALLLALMVASPPVTAMNNVSLDYGNEASATLRSRASQWFSVAPNLPPPSTAPSAAPPSLHVCVGAAGCATEVISDEDMAGLGGNDEGFVLRAQCSAAADGVGPASVTLAIRGATLRSLSYGVFRALEVVGVRFLHPLQPTVLSTTPLASLDDLCALEELSAPHWPLRTWHVHTQHPLELTEVLNGFNTSDGSSWESMLGEVDLFLQWLVANGQNTMEWLLLYAKDFADFAESDLRQARLRSITDMAHQYGLLAAADVPIALRQQHSWFMIKNANDKDWQAQIEKRMDWVLDGAGFDVLGTESGSTEFTHTNCSTMLAWMNHATAVAKAKGKRIWIKCHISDAGTCPDYDDINFNFLPEHADPYLGVLPHTVQTFAFDDPASGTYGQENFTAMFDWAVHMARQEPRREVLYYGETAYWVNFDINVPLFLPLYADRRLRDLRLLRQAELDNEIPRARLSGQLNFCSGWEWGYWFQEVVTARAAWAVPGGAAGLASQKACLRAALKPIVTTLAHQAPQAERVMEDFFVDYIGAQQDLLIDGIVDGERPVSTYKRNGHAYLSGWESMIDVESLGVELGLTSAITQPEHLSLREVMHQAALNSSRDAGSEITYSQDVRPLLVAMHRRFNAARVAWTRIQQDVSSKDVAVTNLLSDISDAVAMTALRATQVLEVYEAANSHLDARRRHLDRAQDAIASAAAVVQRREQKYRVPWKRVAGWRWTPTSYTFGYLWTAHSLLYWWRDLGIVSSSSPEARSPCYLNYQSPIDVAIGEGALQNLAQRVRDASEGTVPRDLLTDCLAAPEDEMVFPADL